ncbi:MAG: PAS domain-containing hybrid sensor histidine kinase/response regulator [Methylobacter sp.]
MTASDLPPSMDIPFHFFDLMPNGVAYCKVLYQDNKPHDFIYLYTNPAFHTLTGLGIVKGKPITEIIPGIRESSPELFEINGAVAAGGLAKDFEVFLDGLQLWLSMQVFSPKTEHFVAIFNVINKRKDEEQSLVTSEKRYKSLVEDQTEMICRFKADGTIIFVNQAFCRLIGKSAESLIGQVWLPIPWPEDLPFINEKLNSLSPSNPVVTIENRIITATGTPRWGQFINRAFFDDDGVLLEIQSVGRDITELKHTEEALRKSERAMNHAQTIAHIGSWRMDVSNNILECSDENFRVFGVPKGVPFTYQVFLDCIHPSDRHLVDAAWKQALARCPYNIEFRIIVDQKVKWVRGLVELEVDPYRSRLSYFVTIQDITEIKTTQEALQYERAFLRKVLDAVPNVIFVRGRDGRFILANQALAQSYGTTSGSIIGLTEESFNSNLDEVTRFYETDLIVINSRQPKLIPDVKVTHADGSTHWYDTVKIPLIEEDQCNKVLIVATDITDRKQAAEVLRLADQRKDEFLAMLAHELRNPLVPIRNAVQLLIMQKINNPMLVRACHIIDHQVTHMVRLLDDLLDVARIIQGKIRLEVERLELADLIKHAVETSLPQIESREQKLIISQAATTPQWINGDRVRLEQVLSNLLNNAAKYTCEGGEIFLNVAQEGPNVAIEVRDTGIGIAADMLPHIFDLFTQADHSLAHSQGGLGIGLTLARQLVEKHSGTITAASAGIGEGSSFIVRLPTVSVNSVTASMLPEPVLPNPKYRILVVDDYPEVAESLMMLLEANGHQVKIARCGMEAVEQAKKFNPQVVLLDIGLPDLDGYEVAKRLRTMSKMRNALLIGLSGYTLREDQSAEFDHYILKPIDCEKLFSLMRPRHNEHR